MTTKKPPSETPERRTRNRRPRRSYLATLSVDGETITFKTVPFPAGVDPAKPSLTKVKAVIKKQLKEDPAAASIYNGQRLAVISFIEAFKFDAEVQTIKTVTIKET